MSKRITSDQLWSMSTKQIADLVRGKTIKVFMKDGSIQHATIKHVSAAPSNP